MTDFISVWRTTTEGESITLPLRNGFGYNFMVDWGDGTSGEVMSFNDADITHTYDSPGDHTVTITGLMETIYFNNEGDKDKIISIPNLGSVSWTSFENAFYGCSNLTTVLGGDTSNVINMRYMFRNATNVQPDTSNWDTTNVTDMYSLFAFTSNANPDTSNWNTSNVTNMGTMFYQATNANPNTAYWDTSSVISMNQMFAEATEANPNTSNWNTGEVTSMYRMFYHAVNATPDTSTWNTANVTDIRGMFYGATLAAPNTSSWNTSSITSTIQMFKDAANANPDVSGWDVSKVTSMAYMFDGATNATPDTSNWDTSSVTNMQNMFRGATNSNPDVSGWDVSNVADMSKMFDRATSAQPDFSSWVPSALTDGTDMLSSIDVGTGSYSALLIQLATHNNYRWVTLDGGNATYTTDGAAARAVLTDDEWTITDGGPTNIEPLIPANAPVAISRSQAPMVNPGASPRATPPVPIRASTPRAPSAPVVSRSKACARICSGHWLASRPAHRMMAPITPIQTRHPA